MSTNLTLTHFAPGINFPALLRKLLASLFPPALQPAPVASHSVLIQANGKFQGVTQAPGADNAPLFDLVIASRKGGYGTTSHASAPILWWKLAGQPKETLTKRVSLTHPLIQKRLAAYELVTVEVHPTTIVRKCRKAVR